MRGDDPNKYNHSGEYIADCTLCCCIGINKKWSCCGETDENIKGCRVKYPSKVILEYPCCGKTRYKENDNDNDDDFHTICGGITYLDTIYSHLKEVGIDQDTINSLRKFAEFEEFDSESMDLDLSLKQGLEGKGGNIYNAIKNDDKCIKHIKNIFDKLKRNKIIYIVSIFKYLFILLIFLCTKLYILFSIIRYIQCWFKF